jgi:hypothetical protein
LVVPECGGTAGQWELVSATLAGTARDDVIPHAPAAISASGGVVAFAHPVDGQRDEISTISVVDLTVALGEPGRSVPVAGIPVEAPTPTFRHRGASAPALSADGRMLAFVSDTTASAAVPDWGTGPAAGEWAVPQVFVWDRDDPDPFTRVTLISQADGVPAAAGASAPSISADGSTVVFASSETALVPARYPQCDGACPSQVFLADLSTEGETAGLTLVSAAPGAGTDGLPTAGDRLSLPGDVNVDGSQVILVTRARNLVGNGPGVRAGNHEGEIVMADLTLGQLRRVTDVAGPGIPAAHANPGFTPDGRTLVFETLVAEQFASFHPGLDLDLDLLERDEREADPDPGALRHVVALVTTPRVSMAGMDFGTVLTEWPSDELFVSVLNEGPGVFRPQRIESSTPEFRISQAGTCRPAMVLAAGESCTVTVVFTPLADEAYEGIIEVAEEGQTAISVSARLSGSGGEPTLQVNPAGVDLGTAVVGTRGPTGEFMLENVGFVRTLISQVSLEGEHAGDFTVISDGCSGVDLNPGVSCRIEVAFEPTTAFRRTAAVMVRNSTDEYTSAVVAGLGRHEVQMVTAEATVELGGQIGLGLMGFPPNTEVHISFEDARRPLSLVRTDAAGGALIAVEVPRRERAGQRVLMASTTSGLRVSVPIELSRPRTSQVGLPGFGQG